MSERTTLQSGSVWTEQLANASGTPTHKGTGEFGDGDLVPDEWLSKEPQHIHSRFYNWFNRVNITVESGLTISYTGASVLLLDGTQTALTAGQLTLPANASSYVFINELGVVTHATSLPTVGVALALAITNSSSITSLVDLRYQTNEQVGVIGGLSTGSGVFDIGDIKQSSKKTPSIGWARCDNALYNNADYPLAASAIGREHSLPSDPIGTFRVPDIADKVVVGASSNRPLGTTEGRDSISLTSSNLPRHSHGVIDPGHRHGADSEHGHNTVDPGHGHPILASYERSGGNTDSLIVEDAAVAGETGGPFGYTTETNSNTGPRIIQKQSTNVRVLAGSANVRIDSNRTGISIREAGDSQSFSVRQPGIALNYYIRLF